MINSRLNIKEKTASGSGPVVLPDMKKTGITHPDKSSVIPGDTGSQESGMITTSTPDPDYESGSVSHYTMPPRKWFFTFMCMNIPVAGWIYLLTKAFGKKETQLRDFSRAYLLYKLVFLVIALILLGIIIYVGLDIADKVLAYMEML